MNKTGSAQTGCNIISERCVKNPAIKAPKKAIFRGMEKNDRKLILSEYINLVIMNIFSLSFDLAVLF